MFKIGDYVVKANDGICEVKDIVNPSFVKDKDKKYYQLVSLKEKSSVLYVPVEKEELLRHALTKEQALALIDSIPDIKKMWIENEREREQSYKKAVTSNDPKKLIAVIKLIYEREKARQENGKKVTAVDGRYFEITQNMLYEELELVMQCDRDAIFEMIRKRCEG